MLLTDIARPIRCGVTSSLSKSIACSLRASTSPTSCMSATLTWYGTRTLPVTPVGMERVGGRPRPSSSAGMSSLMVRLMAPESFICSLSVISRFSWRALFITSRRYLAGSRFSSTLPRVISWFNTEISRWFFSKVLWSASRSSALAEAIFELSVFCSSSSSLTLFFFSFIFLKNWY